MDYNLSDLAEWDEKIIEVAKRYDLDWFPIEYETCDYYEMIGSMAYTGLPTYYPHWSFGKSFERTHQMYNMGMEGLPFELIVNSNPSLAYLMRDNPLFLQILIMAHCVGHSDFFKNNRMFKQTRPETIFQRLRAAKKRIQGYIEDPSIGIEEVEKVLDSCHALQFQTDKEFKIKKSHKELRLEYEDLIKNDQSGKYKDFDLNKIPLEPEFDLLYFISQNAKLSDWKKDIIEVCRDMGQYFWPQIQTKTINEGWACVTGDTLIDTIDGLVTAKELVEQRNGVVFDGESYQNLTDWHYNPSTERVKITTNRGYVIHGSTRHRIWTGSEWKYLTDLNIGEDLEISKGDNSWNKNYQKIKPTLFEKESAEKLAKKFGVSSAQIARHRAGIKTRADINILNKISQIMDEEKDFSNIYIKGKKDIHFPDIICEKLANILGMIIGDGGFWSRSDSNRIKSVFTTGDDELKDLFYNQIKDLFNDNCRLKWDKTKWRVEISSDIITKWLVKTFNFHVGNTAKIKFIPPQIMKSPKPVVSSFLRGLFDTDGCASMNGNVIYVTTSSLLARQVHELLLKFGIVSTLKVNKSNNENHNDCYRVVITGHAVKIFMDEIGFNLTRKQLRLKDFISNKKWFTKTNNTVKIVSIEKDFGEVYDFTVNNTHKYRASCFINHNSFNHYNICHDLNLPDNLHIPFLKLHNQVVRPHIGSLNPYHLGFHMFQKIKERYGWKECLAARENCNDVSFLRQYLTLDDCIELNLFTYSKKQNGEITIDDVSDEKKWKVIKQELISNIGGGSIPMIYVKEISKNGELVLEHEHDGRDLDIDSIKKVLDHAKFLWGKEVDLITKINGHIRKY